MRCIIAEYNRAIESDVVKVKNNLDRLEEKVQESKIFVSEIQGMTSMFSKRVIPNFIDNVSKTSNMLNYYNHMKTLNSTETYTMVYPNHQRDYYPVFDINTTKEVEILANKFRILSTPGVSVQQSYANRDPEEEIGRAEPEGILESGNNFYEESKGEYTNMQNKAQSNAQSKTQNIELPNVNDKQKSRKSQQMTPMQPKQESKKTKLFTEGPDPIFRENKISNTLVSVVSPVRKKIRIVRWLSKKLGEYDIENDFWNSVDSHIDKPFLPFSRSVYLPNQDMVVMGGLNDEIPNKPTFSSQTIKISEVPINVYDSVYSAELLNNMITKRGCFAAIYQYGFIFAIGGLNYTHKILKYCEKFNVATNTWEEIAPMVEPRKNASVCGLTSDTIYVFGGSSSQNEAK